MRYLQFDNNNTQAELVGKGKPAGILDLWEKFVTKLLWFIGTKIIWGLIKPCSALCFIKREGVNFSAVVAIQAFSD